MLLQLGDLLASDSVTYGCVSWTHFQWRWSFWFPLKPQKIPSKRDTLVAKGVLGQAGKGGRAACLKTWPFRKEAEKKKKLGEGADKTAKLETVLRCLSGMKFKGKPNNKSMLRVLFCWTHSKTGVSQNSGPHK